MPIEVGQHHREIQAKAEHWRRKPLLPKIQRDFYAEIAPRCLVAREKR
jgi:hypothetical protein